MISVEINDSQKLPMPTKLVLPNNVSFHTARHFLEANRPFEEEPGDALLVFRHRWAHLEPMALSMVSAWGAWCRRQGKTVLIENLDRRADYAARMRLFHHLGVTYDPGVTEHEASGRFLPVIQVVTRDEVAGVIGSISALLHLEDDPWLRSSIASANYFATFWNIPVRLMGPSYAPTGIQGLRLRELLSRLRIAAAESPPISDGYIPRLLRTT